MAKTAVTNHFGQDANRITCFFQALLWLTEPSEILFIVLNELFRVIQHACYSYRIQSIEREMKAAADCNLSGSPMMFFE